MDEKEHRIKQLEEENRQLKERLLQLERRLGLNSSNSSKPPSSDGLRKKPSPKSLRTTGKKPSGGQVGHKGETLKAVAHPDEIIRYSMRCCEGCGASLAGATPEKTITRQVIDIALPELFVTEYQARAKRCHCGRVNAAFPRGVSAPVQYGSRVKSLAAYLSVQHFIPEDRLQQLFGDVFNLQLATATLARINDEAAGKLKLADEARLAMLKTAAVKHQDETGFRIAGKTEWLHVISNEAATHYRVSAKRGNLLSGVSGITVHDHWKPYFTMEGDVQHALCNAHHLRELRALEEIEKEPWAAKMSKLLRLLSRLKSPEPPLIWRAQQLYDTIVAEGLRFHEQQPRLSSRKNKRRTGHNLLLRLLARKDETLRFLTDPAVPFTNNQAEQDVRMMKVKQKISGGFRTSKGAETFCVIRGFISTLRKNNQPLFATLTNAFA